MGGASRAKRDQMIMESLDVPFILYEGENLHPPDHSYESRDSV